MEQLWERNREGRKETYSRAKYRKPEGKHGKPGKTEGGKLEKRKQKQCTVKATVRQKPEEKERKKQRLSSQNPKLKRTKESENSGGQKVDWKRQSVVKGQA